MSELIQEFFYDVIAKIIPGLVIIVFYGHNILLRGDFKNAAAVLSVCIFLAAWFIGTILESVTFSLPKFLLSGLKGVFPNHKFDEYLMPNCTCNSGNETTDRLTRKLLAEGTMFRCLIVICFMNLCLNPEAFWDVKWCRRYDFLAAILFIIPYIHIKIQQNSFANPAHPDK